MAERQMISKGLVAQNRKANYNYAIEDTIEAGIALTGAEVKSLRYGLANITEAFVQNHDGELVLANMIIQSAKTSNVAFKFDERRYRTLLLHKRQINRMIGQLNEKGATIVPIKIYFNDRGKVKVLLGVGFGKNKVDKRETIKKREWGREKQKTLKTHRQ